MKMFYGCLLTILILSLFSPSDSLIQIGKQSLGCVTRNLGLTLLFGTTRQETIDSTTIEHSIVKYKGTIFEWGQNGYSTGFHPNTPNCRVTWREYQEQNSCSLAQVQNFGNQYANSCGNYRLINNNCHMFASRLIAFINTGCSEYIEISRQSPGWLELYRFFYYDRTDPLRSHDQCNANSFTILQPTTTTASPTIDCPHCPRDRPRHRFRPRNPIRPSRRIDYLPPTRTRRVPIRPTRRPNRRSQLSAMELARRMMSERHSMIARGQK